MTHIGHCSNDQMNAFNKEKAIPIEIYYIIIPTVIQMKHVSIPIQIVLAKFDLNADLLRSLTS